MALFDRFVQGPMPIEQWRQAILADAPHVLIYPDIGMDPAAVALAAQRLARVQCNSWGHPDTSGCPTVDYYLSSDLMEPSGADAHYTERLIRLPNLSVYYEPADAPATLPTREELGLRPDATVYWSGQSLFKYLPQHDDVFPRVAKEVPGCQFVFITYYRGDYVTGLFRQRLDRAFDAFGLRADDHCVFLPRLKPAQFVAAASVADIFLDSIEWSGCNSTLECLTHDVPVVTIPGAMMRGRHGMAILKMMGITETICDTIDDYVATAVRLGRDAEWRTQLRRRIADCKPRLYRDRSVITALEDFSNAQPAARPRAPAGASMNNDVPPAPDSLLRHRPFVLFWNARVFAAIAFQMVGVAMGWQMYSLTGSALDLGLVGLAQFLPMTVLILVAGQLADRYDRRHIAQISQCVESLAAATLAYGAFTGTTTREMIFAAAFLLGAGRAGESPTMQTLLPAVVPAPMFPRAVAASSSAQQAATIAGPAVGGLIYAFSPTAVYGICFVLFAAAATQLAFLRYERVGLAAAGFAGRILRRHRLHVA